ncbi:hypothetical protein IT570_00985 [Candidatus Sumerlaeota bacterium]|nr:hypothetical protein [Candidatus Sumerlaeota bacterium]
MKRTLKTGTIFLSGLLAGAIALPVLGAAGKGLRERAQEDHPALAAWRAKARGGDDEGRRHENPPPPPGTLALGGRVGPLLENGPFAGALKALFPFWQDADIATKLGLTSQQVSQLEESWTLAKSELESGKGDLRDIGKELREELQKDNPDLATVDGLADQFTNDLNAKGKAVLGHAVTVKTVLTAEQEEQVKELVKKALADKREAMEDLREDIRESFENGGKMEDAEAIIDASGLGEPYETIAKNMLHHIAENGGPHGRRPHGPPPPPPPTGGGDE